MCCGKKGMPRSPAGARIVVTTPDGAASTPDGAPPALGADDAAVVAQRPIRKQVRRRPRPSLPGRAIRRF